MIQRFVTTLPAVAALAPGELASERARRLIADAADAVRLELDCPQQSLTPREREMLHALGDLLETEPAGAELPEAARRACALFGLGAG
jgi:hypothetical protein